MFNNRSMMGEPFFMQDQSQVFRKCRINGTYPVRIPLSGFAAVPVGVRGAVAQIVEHARGLAVAVE